MIVSQIAAMSENRAIGLKGGLPWHIPEDLKFFRDKTRGHPCVMGRKTFDSLGGKPLPGRLNVVITRQKDYRVPDGVEVYPNLEAALEALRPRYSGQEVFITGGGEVYSQAMSVTDRIYLTVIHSEFEGDAFFPPIPDHFREIEKRPGRDDGAVKYTFTTWERTRS